jgi:hypothetical protein
MRDFRDIRDRSRDIDSRYRGPGSQRPSKFSNSANDSHQGYYYNMQNKIPLISSGMSNNFQYQNRKHERRSLSKERHDDYKEYNNRDNRESNKEYSREYQKDYRDYPKDYNNRELKDSNFTSKESNISSSYKVKEEHTISDFEKVERLKFDESPLNNYIFNKSIDQSLLSFHVDSKKTLLPHKFVAIPFTENTKELEFLMKRNLNSYRNILCKKKSLFQFKAEVQTSALDRKEISLYEIDYLENELDKIRKEIASFNK